ncbi:MAG: hypothetical protein U5L09_22785 [Bacteroidales bacterium]|nr:hypothetical protein [Bacteroidales bacterium]
MKQYTLDLHEFKVKEGQGLRKRGEPIWYRRKYRQVSPPRTGIMKLSKSGKWRPDPLPPF